MGKINKVFSFTMASTLALSAAAGAAPIRVLIFNTCGPGGFLHDIKGQVPIIKKMLLNPADANLQNPVFPTNGFTVDSIGTAGNGTTTDGHNLVLALATHDVVVCPSNTQFTGLFTTADQAAFLAWAQAKGHGVVAYHGSTDDNANWPAKITYFGGKFTSHVSAPAAVLEDSTRSNSTDANFQALNAGLDKSYTINDEWYSYQVSSRTIPGIQVLSTLNEATYKPTDKMGDHPISWFRAPADGGRLYYTGAGHNTGLFKDNYWLRRQLYNGILWASGWSPPSTIQQIENKSSMNAQSNNAQVSGSSLMVSVGRDGAHVVEIRALNGQRVAMQRGVGKVSYTFSNLKANSVYAVLVSTPHDKTRQLITTR